MCYRGRSRLNEQFYTKVGQDTYQSENAYLTVIQLPINKNLPLRNVSREIRNRVSDICEPHPHSQSRHSHDSQIKALQPTIIRHSQNRNLRNTPVPPGNPSSPLINSRQIRVHVTRVPTPTGHLLPRRRNLTQSIGVRTHVRQDDEYVFFQLVGVVFGGGEGETGRDDAFDAV